MNPAASEWMKHQTAPHTGPGNRGRRVKPSRYGRSKETTAVEARCHLSERRVPPGGGRVSILTLRSRPEAAQLFKRCVNPWMGTSERRTGFKSAHVVDISVSFFQHVDTRGRVFKTWPLLFPGMEVKYKTLFCFGGIWEMLFWLVLSSCYKAHILPL